MKNDKEQKQQKEAPYSAIDIAYWFIRKSLENGEILSLVKLMILCYYAQGIFLAIDDKPLFKEKIQAWEYGPAIPEVYEHFKNILEFDKGYKKISVTKDNYRFNPDGSIDIKENDEYRKATEDEKVILALGYGKWFGGELKEDSIHI